MIAAPGFPADIHSAFMRYSVHPPGTDYYCCPGIQVTTSIHHQRTKQKAPALSSGGPLHLPKKMNQASLRLLRAANPIRANRERVAVVGSGMAFMLMPANV